MINIHPGSKFEKLYIEGQELHLKIQDPPLKGKANQYVIKYFSNLLNVPKNYLEIAHGEL